MSKATEIKDALDLAAAVIVDLEPHERGQAAIYLLEICERTCTEMAGGGEFSDSLVEVFTAIGWRLANGAWR